MLIPLIGAVIGWITNVLAIKLLFRPYRPWKVPLLGYELQGLLPRRRAEIARSIGKVIEAELLSPELILGQILNPGMKAEIAATMVATVEKKVQANLPVIIPAGIARMLLDYLRSIMEREAAGTLDEMVDQLSVRMKEDLSLGQMVEDRLAQMEMAGLERLVLQVAARELRHIEILGGVLGFAIGLLQGAIVFWLSVYS